MTGVLLARGLGPLHRGELAAVILWPSILAAVGSLGIADATTFYIARSRHPRRSVTGTAFVVAAFEAVVLISVGYVLLPHVLVRFDEDVVRLTQLLLLFVPLNLASLIVAGALSGSQRYTAFQIVRSVPVAANLAGFAGLAMWGHLNVTSGALVYLVSNGLTLLIAILFYSRGPDGLPAFQRDLVPKLLSFGLKSHLGGVSSLFNERLDQLVISAMLAPIFLGKYVVAVTLTSATTLVGTSVALVAFPKIANSEDRDRFRLGSRFIAVTVAFSMLITVPLLLFTNTLVNLFFGEAFESVTNVARVLLVAAVVLSTNRVLGALLSGMGRPLDQGLGELLALVVTVVSLAALLPAVGLMGAAFASLLAYATSLAWMAKKFCSVGAEAQDEIWRTPVRDRRRQKVGETTATP
jgi:O-antigen/teichoic acid export membrane protein